MEDIRAKEWQTFRKVTVVTEMGSRLQPGCPGLEAIGVTPVG